MKRQGRLFERICNFDALVKAAFDAARGKKKNKKIARFLMDVENEIISLEKELKNQKYNPQPYRIFEIYDPKRRRICASDFRDRVVHKAICQLLGPVFDRRYIYDSYACRENKGPYAAVERAQSFALRRKYYLQFDVRKYFDSINHAVLKEKLARIIRDEKLLFLLDIIIDHAVPWSKQGNGIPIGNLTSQHFVNYYLDELDHMIKEKLGIPGYIRYMDDMVMFDNEKNKLWNAFESITQFLKNRLSLEIKDGSVRLSPVYSGLPFLGFTIFPRFIRINRKCWKRFRKKTMTNEKLFMEGYIDEEDMLRSMYSLLGHLRHAETRNLRASFFHKRPGALKALTG